MIKSKIFYGLCISALILPFAEATKENWRANNGRNDVQHTNATQEKPVKSPQHNHENNNKGDKKPVRKEGAKNNSNTELESQSSALEDLNINEDNGPAMNLFFDKNEIVNVQDTIITSSDSSKDYAAIIKYLSAIGLTYDEVKETLNCMFDIDSTLDVEILDTIRGNHYPNNEEVRFFYEIDDWLCLTDFDKEKIKNELLKCEITWKKVAKFLGEVCSIGGAKAIEIINKIFRNKVKCWKDINELTIFNSKQSDHTTLDRITFEDLATDLASLGVLDEIYLHLDETQKKVVERRMKELALLMW